MQHNANNHILTTTLVRCALTVALMVVFFTLFRGFANLLNAFMVPMTFYMGLKNTDRTQAITLFGAVVVAGLLFFSVQVFFILLYFTMALLLRRMVSKSVTITLSGLVLAVVAAVGIYAGIRLTDLVFLTRLHTIYMAMLNGNVLYYALMLAAEGLMAGFGLAFGARAVERRMPAFPGKA